MPLEGEATAKAGTAGVTHLVKRPGGPRMERETQAQGTG